MRGMTLGLTQTGTICLKSLFCGRRANAMNEATSIAAVVPDGPVMAWEAGLLGDGDVFTVEGYYHGHHLQEFTAWTVRPTQEPDAAKATTP